MLKISFLNLFRRKSRTILSLLGIMIGVAVIITMVSIVDGSQQQFTETINMFQGIIVMQKNAVDNTLSVVDESYAAKLAKITNVKNVIKEIYFLPSSIDDKSTSVSASSLTSTVFVYGINPSEYNKSPGNGWLGEIGEGSFLNSNDKGYVVIGKTFADKHNKYVNSTIKIKDKKFKVKGILKNENELLGNIIVMHIDKVRELSSFKTGKVSSFYVELKDPSLDKKTADIINFQFSDIEANTASDFSNQLNDVLGNFRLIVFFVAAISALVAGIGIMNTMLMSVMERTREIGTLLAVGWSKENVILMIMLESIFLGILGGLLGIILGIIASNALALIINIKGLITLTLLVEAFGFAFFLSLIAGIYPALKASKLNPIEAIRTG